jgi:hypothetical protein
MEIGLTEGYRLAARDLVSAGAKAADIEPLLQPANTQSLGGLAAPAFASNTRMEESW